MLVAQLKSFFMVARLGSITLAAKQLGLSQPTVTSQIRALEEAYGVELFYRGGRRLALSDAGAVSYTHLTLPTNNPWCRSRWSPYH